MATFGDTPSFFALALPALLEGGVGPSSAASPAALDVVAPPVWDALDVFGTFASALEDVFFTACDTLFCLAPAVPRSLGLAVAPDDVFAR